MLTELRQLNATMNQAQQQLASGKKVTVASDAPADVQSIVQNQSDLARVQQSEANLNTLNSEVGMASTVLENAAQLMDSARSIGAQGASDTSDASTRQLLASQIQDIETQMVGIANSTNAGRYLFAGDADTTAPYSIDFANTPPFSANTTALATRLGMDSMGNTFPIAMTATDIFNNATSGNNVLQSLEALRQGLLSGDDTAINAANSSLASAATYLGSVQAYYGTAQSTITSALDVASKSELSIQSNLSDLTSADTAEAITAEESAQTQQQAVLSMRAKMSRGSLFDMLG
jgi:flagellar hook-associated protein 3 FlgL